MPTVHTKKERSQMTKLTCYLKKLEKEEYTKPKAKEGRK